jgi:hypothetical protein
MSIRMKNKTNRHHDSTTGLKYLIATLAVAATIALWSIFSTRDQVAQVMDAQSQSGVAAGLAQTNGLMVDPLPTLVPILLPDGEVVVVQEQSQPLRSVSAPQITTGSSNTGPLIVGGGTRTQQNTRSGGGTRTTTRTRSSG